MTVRDCYNTWLDTLTPLIGDSEARAVTKEAFSHFIGMSHVDIVLKGDHELGASSQAAINDALKKISKGMPVQYVTGEAWFNGLKLKVGPGVLIPRPETSQLVDIIVKDFSSQSDLRIIDLCTGSGAIALALERALPFTNVVAVDISPDALGYAKINGNDLHSKIQWIQADVFDYGKLPTGEFDIIVSNPPYIPQHEVVEIDRNVIKNEPALALIVPDSDPTIFYSRISAWAKSHLSSNGCLYFEINPHYAASIKKILNDNGFFNVDILCDYTGKQRFVKAWH